MSHTVAVKSDDVVLDLLPRAETLREGSEDEEAEFDILGEEEEVSVKIEV